MNTKYILHRGRHQVCACNCRANREYNEASSSGRDPSEPYPQRRVEKVPPPRYVSRSNSREAPQNQARPNSKDPFSAFKQYQQAAMLRDAGVGRSAYDAGMRPDLGWLPSSRERAVKTNLSKGWFVKPEFTVETLYSEILSRCEQLYCGDGPLFMIMKLSQTREDARTCLDAVSAVRANRIRRGSVQAFDPRLCAMFTQMCVTCDAPDVMAEALHRSNELGLLLGLNRIHRALMTWGANLELHKIEQVAAAMEIGGVPPTTKTGYIMIRAAVNSGRQEVAERYAAILRRAGVRLHPSSLRLLELGRLNRNASTGIVPPGENE
ncbi:hypothetical protein CEUSTIGMA_g4345.t1 [Chlamydomonas eustigma]|uniref:Uncharacterized protein n=1 Tax=Chlamydomonas eustigma TaxID=1157962 RepID=A0A250X1T5_9CHLO|nr:hypothetical protein CEUSTIGMA_g4345.t1 [Chlamydomonas eustigma]|eukprot:GAX76899.1 hypothetical protein CEUSTIGMA_g4345.t1 [Chlamydomonas eustigma]